MAMGFEELLTAAKSGDREAQEAIVQMYAPMLQRLSIVNRRYDEDLYQELSCCLLDSIRTFQV